MELEGAQASDSLQKLLEGQERISNNLWGSLEEQLKFERNSNAAKAK